MSLFKVISEALSFSLAGKVGHDEIEFMRRLYETDLDVYRDRLRAIGLMERRNILDAGCGFGQWTIALSGGNTIVHAMDIAPERVEATRTALDLAEVSGAEVYCASFTDIPKADATYDAIFAYSSVCFSPWKESLSEFYRVMKPGGRIYFTMNDIGYTVFQWLEQPNKSETHSPQWYAAKSLENTLYYREHGELQNSSYVVVGKDEVRDHLRQLGFSILALGAEGSTQLQGDSAPPMSFFRPEYHDLPVTYEVVAEKK